jgi:hypothetical protein
VLLQEIRQQHQLTQQQQQQPQKMKMKMLMMKKEKAPCQTLVLTHRLAVAAAGLSRHHGRWRT